VYKVEPVCSVKQSLIGLHNVIMSLYTLCKRSSSDDEQIQVSMSGQIFFSSVPDGVFNDISSFTDLEGFGSLHGAIQSNTLSNAHFERNMRQYAHYADPLFYKFTSKEALRWVTS